jgi:hypothetical protein
MPALPIFIPAGPSKIHELFNYNADKQGNQGAAIPNFWYNT